MAWSGFWLPQYATQSSAAGGASPADVWAYSARTLTSGLENLDAPISSIGSFSLADSARLLLVERILRNKLVTDPGSGVMTLYDDGGGVLMTAQLYQDAAGTVPYQGKGAERRERLA